MQMFPRNWTVRHANGTRELLHIPSWCAARNDDSLHVLVSHSCRVHRAGRWRWYVLHGLPPISLYSHTCSRAGTSIQYCDLNQAPDVPLFRKTFQGKEWTLVRRVQPGYVTLSVHAFLLDINLRLVKVATQCLSPLCTVATVDTIFVIFSVQHGLLQLTSCWERMNMGPIVGSVALPITAIRPLRHSAFLLATMVGLQW